MEDNALALDVQILLALLHVPPHLTDFFREVQIGQYLADNKAKENNSQGISAAVSFDRVSSRTIELESNFYLKKVGEFLNNDTRKKIN